MVIKKETWIKIIKSLIAVLTATLTYLRVTSCTMSMTISKNNSGSTGTEVKERVKNIIGERALQGWSQRQLMTISDSELKSYSEGAGWTKGWSEGTSQGTSQSEGKQFGGSVGVKVLGNGGNISGNYGYNESESQNTSESKSENKGANTSKSETTSTGGTRNVVVWPKYNEKGELEHLYMVILNGDYKNISMEFRKD